MYIMECDELVRLFNGKLARFPNRTWGNFLNEQYKLYKGRVPSVPFAHLNDAALAHYDAIRTRDQYGVKVIHFSTQERRTEFLLRYS